MIDCIITLDYEIYGNGQGSLKELVYKPTEKLRDIFDAAGMKMVVFVETAALEKIQYAQSDTAIDNVTDQIRELFEQGHEIALHIHPQWCNARYSQGRWELDYSEYNLCILPKKRISEIIGKSIAYLRSILIASDFTPLSFRAGNWLFQPTGTAMTVLADYGIKVDSSVFKGGLQHQHNLDYRRAIRNGYYWKFQDDVTIAEPSGVLLEIPIYTRMLPFWKVGTKKRVSLQQKGASGPRTASQWYYRFLDLARFKYPLKFDFCRMTISELTSMIDALILEDQQNPNIYKPIVAIGHSKDLVDFETIESFLCYLNERRIIVSTFNGVYDRCLSDEEPPSKGVATK